MDTLMGYVGQVHRYFAKFRGAQVEEDGVTSFQCRYLLILCKTPGLSQEQLAKEILVNKSNVTRQLALLEQGGFITREPSGSDRRRLLVYPTDRAYALLPKIKKVMGWWNENLLAPFTDEEKETLLALMRRVCVRAGELSSRSPGEV